MHINGLHAHVKKRHPKVWRIHKMKKIYPKERERRSKTPNIKHPRTEFVSDGLVGFFVEQATQISDWILVHRQPLHKVL